MKFDKELAWPCRDCAVRDSSFCGKLINRQSSDAPSTQNQLSQVFMRANKHEVMRENKEPQFAGPFVLCKGWAYRFFRFSDGRRQILSVLIPGDLFSAFSLFNPNPAFSVQSATEISVCQLGRDGIKQKLTENASVFEAYGKLCSDEIADVTSTSIGLSHSNAAKRIADFVQRLVKRLSARGIRISANVYPLPITQTDIADATGLSPEQVASAIHELRKDGIIDLSNDEVTILDTDRFG